MAVRIQIDSFSNDTRGKALTRKFNNQGADFSQINIAQVYTVEGDFSQEQLEKIASALTVFGETVSIQSTHTPDNYRFAVEIGFLPGVTDNVAKTAKQTITDTLKEATPKDLEVYTSELFFVSGDIVDAEVKALADLIHNPVIQRYDLFSEEDIKKIGLPIVVPKVKLTQEPKADLVDILNASDEELTTIGKKGIANEDGTRRGPLALDLTYMKTIQSYFREQNRNPTDIELESIAQTWSEHCKHTIFADPMDEIDEGIYKRFIKGATQKIRELKGDKDFCISVFSDNSGVIVFDQNWAITDKVETHNSPSALDPYGGSITGIVGVNRDTIGTGKGAKPIINRYGFCFADPNDLEQLKKSKDQTMLLPRRIMDGVIEGVKDGGNQSGIPTPQGFVLFEDRYKGKPLVYVGTIGLITRLINEQPSHQKQAQPGDYIVMVGGRVGKDGIHGATFSSEALDSGSPATAVQIGDALTQKKLSDAIIKEARDLDLFTSITDNGAGGISCSVAEMAKEAGGCNVELDKVPLKYQGLQPWEIWISEAQERMTLAVPKEKWDELSDLFERRDVEATIIGEFTQEEKCIVNYEGKTIVDLDMQFLHDGLPKRPMKTTYTRPSHPKPKPTTLNEYTITLHQMLRRQNIASKAFISEQYDHEVQAGSVIKPLQGRGRVNGDATVTRPLLESKKGVVITQGINPTYSDIDTYAMAAAAIDTAVRNAICTGANPEHLALLDNFCWCSSNEPERLGQLKSAAQACYDTAIAYQTPFISGKDSMFNDFKGIDQEGNPIKISIPPTLLISSIGVMDDIHKAISLDVKIPGDLVYVIGETKDELGASEWYAHRAEQEQLQYIGNSVPQVNTLVNKQAYSSLADCIEEEIIASAQSVHRGGLAVALAKKVIGGQWGMDLNFAPIQKTAENLDAALYSESQGRVVVTINPNDKKRFEHIMQNSPLTYLGTVTDSRRFKIKARDSSIVVDTQVKQLHDSYHKTFRGF